MVAYTRQPVTSAMKFDDLVEVVGGFGRYQKTVFFLLFLTVISSAVHAMITVFTMGVPDHRCAIPGLENDTYAIQGDDHARTIASTIPPDLDGGQRYSSCLLYVADVTVRGVEGDNKTSYECDRWVYDTASFGSTIVTQLNWVCTRKLNKSIAQMTFKLGVLLGFFVLTLSDIFGGKNMLMLGILLHVISTVSLTFASTFEVFGILYFLDGAASIRLWNNAFILGVELVGPSKRVFVGIAVDVVWSIGSALCGLAAYYVRDWQLLQLILSVPSVIFLVYFWLIRESPRWLINRGRHDEAEKTLQQIAKTNGSTFTSETCRSIELTTNQEESWLNIFKNAPFVLIKNGLVIFLGWIASTFGFYTLGLGIQNLGGNVYTNYFISTLVEIIGFAAALLLLDCTGRKPIYCTSLIVGGVSCIMAIIPIMYNNASMEWLTVTLAMIGRGFVSTAFATVWLYTSELFPTVIRSSTLAAANIISRWTGAASPYIANMAQLIPGKFGKILPLVIVGVIMTLAGLVALILPETLKRKLPETINDAVVLQRGIMNSDNGDDDHEGTASL